MNRLRAIILFLRLVWRKWDEGTCSFGCKHIYRIDIKTAWQVAKGLKMNNTNINRGIK